MTQAEVAELVDVQTPYYRAIESGKKNPSLTTLAALANAFGVAPMELLREAEPPSRATGRPRKKAAKKTAKKTR